MTVTAPPRAPETGRDRDLEQRVAELEALIEEALTAYQADALTTNGDGSPEQLDQIRRELRDDLLGLGQLAERMLADEDARRNLIEDVVEYAVQAHQVGIVVDFEGVPDKSQPDFRDFAGELASALHAVGLKLMMQLPARDESYDYKFFGKECDAIVLMNTDQHWVSSPPGPVAAQDWFVENLHQVLSVVPPQKVIVGIANFAYD